MRTIKETDEDTGELAPELSSQMVALRGWTEVYESKEEYGSSSPKQARCGLYRFGACAEFLLAETDPCSIDSVRIALENVIASRSIG